MRTRLKFRSHKFNRTKPWLASTVLGAVSIILPTTLPAQTSADSITVTFRSHESPSTTLYLPGEFNGWTPNSAISRMTYDASYASWIKTLTFKIKDGSDQSRRMGDSIYQYKFNRGGVDGGWMSDPLNPETNPNDNNNSVLRLARLFWFEYYQQESGSEITRIIAGLPHGNADSIGSILFSTGAEVSTTLPVTEVISSFDRTRRIFSYTPPAPIPKTNYVRLVAYNDKGDSVVFAKGGYVVPRMLMPGNTSHGITLQGPVWGDSTTFRLRVRDKAYVLLRIAPVGQPVATAPAIVMRKNVSSGDDWWMNLKLNPGSYEYLYELEDGKLLYDPWGRHTGDQGTRFTVGPEGLTADDYAWQTIGYQRPSMERLVIYELNVGEFGGGFFNRSSSQPGTFADLRQLLPHLDSLGVNAIELMPVNDYGAVGRSGHSWGYDLNSYFALEPVYGTPRDFKALVDAAHARGIAVIVDVVFNHLNDTSPLWLMQPDEDANPYFKRTNDPRFNEDALFFFKDMDHWTRETQEIVYTSLKMWLDVYKVDGFRYDFTQGIGWTTLDPTVGIPGWANRIATEYGDSVYQIAEHLPESPALIYHSGITGGWHDSFRDELFDEARFRNRDLSKLEDLVLDLGAYTSNDQPSTPDRYAGRTEPVNATVTHDEQSLIYEMSVFQNVPIEEAVQRDKLYATFMFTSLGIPMLWQGMEWAEPRGWSSDGQKLVYRPLRWSLRSTERGKGHFNHYRSLILQRKLNSALTSGVLRTLGRYTTERVLVWGLEDTVSNAGVMVVANLSGVPRTMVNVPWLSSGTWYDVFDESILTVPTVPVPSITIPEYTARVFSNRNNAELGIPTPVERQTEGTPSTFALHQNYPNPFNPTTTIAYSVPQTTSISLKVYTLLGEEVATLKEGEMGPGRHITMWDGRNVSGQTMASGIYFVRLQAGAFTAIRKLMVLR